MTYSASFASVSFRKKCEALWVQFSSTGNLCLRIITKGSICPPVLGDGVALSLTQRVAATITFPVTVWEVSLPQGIKIIKVEDLQLSLPSVVKKIAFIGDTGCRPLQECTATQWPFQQIAKRVLADQPDLIVHLGDCIYRHLEAQQKSSSHHINFDEGDNWLGWQKEFFEPLADVLPFVPWVFVRGNQESRSCASEGWRRFLDGYPYREDDIGYDPPYVLALDKVNLIVHDSSYVYPDHKQIWPNTQLDGLNLPEPNPTWLLTHRPVWGIVNDQKHNEGVPLIIMNEHGNLQAFLEPFPQSLTTIFSGHIHAFQAIKLFSYEIYQFVIGNGGVALEANRPPEILKNTHLEDQKIEDALSLIIFGYGLADYSNAEWTLTLKDIKGAVIDTFLVPSRAPSS
jgi:predicted phosphodiesterase